MDNTYELLVWEEPEFGVNTVSAPCAAARFESAILGPDTSAEGKPQARTLLAEEVAFSVYSSPEATACSPASTRLPSLPWRSS